MYIVSFFFSGIINIIIANNQLIFCTVFFYTNEVAHKLVYRSFSSQLPGDSRMIFFVNTFTFLSGNLFFHVHWTGFSHNVQTKKFRGNGTILAVKCKSMIISESALFRARNRVYNG